MSTVAVDVSRAGLWDAEALSDVAAATFPLACPPGASADDIEVFIDDVLSTARFGEYLSDPAKTVLKATNGKAIVGYAMLIDGEPTDSAVAALLTVRPTIEVSKMYVLPGHQGTGVSTALMDAAVAFARAHNFASLWLGVNQHNDRAQRFYAKHGFDRLGTRIFEVGSQTHDDYVMQRKL